MALSICSFNTLTILSLLWLLTSYSAGIGNASERYPYVLPKCCQSVGENAIADGVSRTAKGRSIGSCERVASVVVILPKQLFPAMSTNSDHVEVELRNSIDGLQCDGTHPRYSDIDLTLRESFRSVSVGKKETFDKVAFSGDNLLAPDGHIYTPNHFCISSRTTNKTRLAIKTCKRTCSQQHPCIQRCCGGHQSILTSPPASSNESFLGFCSSPSLRNDSWNPSTSTIVRGLHQKSLFHQTSYAPQIDNRRSGHAANCFLFRFTDSRLKLLSDGRLMMSEEHRAGEIRTAILDNFCLDGINEVGGGNFFPPIGDICDASEEKEVVVAYFCSQQITSVPTLPQTKTDNDIMSFPACSCLATVPKNPIPFPLIFRRTGLLPATVPFASLTTGGNPRNLECPQGYMDFTAEYENITMELYFFKGSLMLRQFLFSQSHFCIRSVFHNALTVRTCKWDPNTSPSRSWDWWNLSCLVGYIHSQLFYVAIAVVYILRMDKDLVLRCSIVGYSISSFFTYFLHTCNVFISNIAHPIVLFIIDIGIDYTYRHALSWLSVLCYDVWFHITFLRPGRKSTKRLRGYVGFAFTLPAIQIFMNYIKRIIDPNSLPSIVLDYLMYLFSYGIIGGNMLLCIATAVKLWVSQNSSDIKNQKNRLLMYFKLFLLTGLSWVLESSVIILPRLVALDYNLITVFVTAMLLLLQPALTFFFLVWDKATKIYMETNHPRVKRAMDFLAAIGYPVRKSWGLCKRCRRYHVKGTNGSEGIEAPHNSNHMYVHTRRAANIPKARLVVPPANKNVESAL